jgi:hypothetical protein
VVAISSSVMLEVMLPPSKPNWMPRMQGKCCVQKIPFLNQMQQLRWMMWLHQLRAGPGATLGLQAPCIALSVTHDVCI